MKKKVCFIISGTMYSGAEIVLNRYLENNNCIEPFFVIIFNFKDVQEKFKKIYGDERVECLNINYNKNLIRYMMPFVIYNLNKKLGKSRFIKESDLIYVNNTTEGILCSKFISNKDKRSILHIHDMKECYTHPYNKYIINKYFKEYNEILTVSYATKKSWNPLNMKIIYNGLNEEYFQIKRKIDSIRKIGFVGSLNYRKGADYLVDSLGKLLNYTELKFFFVFKEYDNKLLSKLKQYECDRVKILNNLNEREMVKFYDYIDAIIVPSRLDPLPTVIMEAQARGKLVVGNKKSGIPEMIPIKKFTKEINTSNDIVELIEEIIDINQVELENIQKENFEYSKNKFNDALKKKEINKIIYRT